jgi:hypothetical protein
LKTESADGLWSTSWIPAFAGMTREAMQQNAARSLRVSLKIISFQSPMNGGF